MYYCELYVLNNVNDGQLKVLVSTDVELTDKEKEEISKMKENDARQKIKNDYHGNMARL